MSEPLNSAELHEYAEMMRVDGWATDLVDRVRATADELGHATTEERERCYAIAHEERELLARMERAEGMSDHDRSHCLSRGMTADRIARRIEAGE